MDYKTTHYHCPYNCEHPQPFFDGVEYICGRCWIIDNVRVVMILCTPEICGED
jgi:hypothetical protein